MRVFVAGGTGAIGKHAVTALIKDGHTVTALARTAEKATQLRQLGAEPVILSIFDRVALTVAFAGQDTVVNLTSAIPPITHFMHTKAWQANDRVRTEGSAAIVDAALAAGVARVVQESVSMIYPDGGDQWIDENVPPDNFPMARANLAAEANTRRFVEKGGAGVVLRFGWFYGPGATHSEQFLTFARYGLGVMMGRATSYVSSIHMFDAATAVTSALRAPSGIFNIVDDEPLTKRHYADAISSALGRRIWFYLPGRAALLLGDRATSLTRSLRVSNARFKHLSGWTPRYPSVREGWIATANSRIF